MYNAPSPDLDVAGFRRRYGIADEGIHVVTVTRLAHELKLEGLLTAVDTVDQLGGNVTLTIVGDGPASAEVRAAAAATNAKTDRTTVVLTGQLESAPCLCLR